MRYRSRKQYPDSTDAGTGLGWDQWHEIVDLQTGYVVLSAVLDAEVIDVTEALNKAYQAGRDDKQSEIDNGL